MQSLNKKDKELHIHLNTEELNQVQVRLLKNTNALMVQLMTAEDEAEYFELCSQMMVKMAEIVKHAHFANNHKEMNYGEQALEFSLDFLNESLDQTKYGNIDN